MKNELERHRKLEKDLLKQIDLCNRYKAQIEKTLRDLHEQHKTGLIDSPTYKDHVDKYLQGKHPHHWYSLYDDHINKCSTVLGQCKESIAEITDYLSRKRNLFSKAFMIMSFVFLLLGAIIFIDPSLTGFIVHDTISKTISEDGYGVEGFQWVEIKGSRFYERCLKVNSESEFNAIKIIAKIMGAGDKKDLAFSLYNHDGSGNEPSELIKSCSVTDFDELWKSCTISNLKQDKDNYWICASSPGGNKDETQHTITYQIGDNKRTALWTGKNWQKLDRYSYTIKAQFMKNE